MPKLNSTNDLQAFSRFRLVLVFASIFLFLGSSTLGQKNAQSAKTGGDNSEQISREVLPARLGSLWHAVSEPRNLTPERFAVVQGAEVYLEYGLRAVITRVYTDGKNQVVVEAFEMQYPSGAYGLFTFNRGSLSPCRQEFPVGRFMISISCGGSTSLEKAQIAPDLVDAIQQHLADGPVELPPLPSHLPQQSKVADSEKYLVGPAAIAQLPAFNDLKDIIRFTGGAEATTADYTNGGGQMSLIIFEYHTPQLASDSYAELKSHFNSLPSQEREHRLIRRVGNYIIEAVNVRDAKAAQEIIGQIKYTARVYWEGDKSTAIPLPYRPPDKAAIEEAKRTAQFLFTTFYMIGLAIIGAAMLGILAGGSLFYWRRHRRRKLGLDESFSDAGGTIRLNLDNYLLAAGKPEIKLLGKND